MRAETEMTDVRLRVSREALTGDPIDWIAQNSGGGAWVQLADKVIARHAGGGWLGSDGGAVALRGWVDAAEGASGEGQSWRLRRVGGEILVWRYREGEGDAAKRMDRKYRSTWARAQQLEVREYWTQRARPELSVDGAVISPWTPTAAVFSQWMEG